MARSESLSDLLDVIEKYTSGKKGRCECGIELNTNFHHCTCHPDSWMTKKISSRLELQKKVVDHIQNIIEMNENIPPANQKRAILVQAPTGFGKSWFAIALAMKYGASILTSTVDLQEQYRKDFTFMPNVKGKERYDCLQHHNEKNCLSGYCNGCKYDAKTTVKIDQKREQERETNPTLGEKFIHISTDDHNNEQVVEGTGIECSYYNALKEGTLAYSAIYNYYSYLVSNQLPDRPREVLICDEADAYEEAVVGVSTVRLDNELTIELLDEINPNTKQERPGLLDVSTDDEESRITIDVEGKLVFDPALDDEGKIRYVMKFIQLLLNRFETKRHIYDRCKEHTLDLLHEGHVKKHSELRCEKGHNFALVEKNHKKITKGCRTSPKAGIRGCTELRNYIKEDKFLECKDPSHHICRDDGLHWECNEDHTKYNHEMHIKLKTYVSKLENLIEDLNAAAGSGNITDWGVISTDDDEIGIAPMNTRNITQYLLKAHSTSTVFLSSTTDWEMFLAQTKIKRSNMEYMELDNLIPVSHRPIKFLKDAIPMGGAALRRPETWIKVMPKIRKILEKHKGERGIILLTNYDQLYEIFDRQDELLKKRLTFDWKGEDFEITRKKHLGKTDSVIVTAKGNQGIDLSYHESRFQIILKAPYIPKVRRGKNIRWDRMYEENPDRFWKESAFRFVQFCGRSVRHIDDAAVTYVLDRSAKNMIQNLPDWCKKAVEEEADIMPDGSDCVWRTKE